MSWQHWILLALYVIRMIALPFAVGEKREPVTLEGAVTGFFVCVVLIMLLVWGQ